MTDDNNQRVIWCGFILFVVLWTIGWIIPDSHEDHETNCTQELLRQEIDMVELRTEIHVRDKTIRLLEKANENQSVIISNLQKELKK